VKKKMLEDEHSKVARGMGNCVGNGITACDFIIEGLDLEEQQ
jgi:hypothetical protein